MPALPPYNSPILPKWVQFPAGFRLPVRTRAIYADPGGQTAKTSPLSPTSSVAVLEFVLEWYVSRYLVAGLSHFETGDRTTPYMFAGYLCSACRQIILVREIDTSLPLLNELARVLGHSCLGEES